MPKDPAVRSEKPAIPPLYRRVAAVWLAGRLLYAAAFAALVLLPAVSSWAALSQAAPAFAATGRLEARPQGTSPFTLMADFLKVMGIKPTRAAWQPTGVDYGNTMMPPGLADEPVCLAWQYNPKKLNAVPPGVNALAPTWFYVEDNNGVAEVNDLGHLRQGKVSNWSPAQYVKAAHDGGAKVWASIVCIGKADLAKQIVTDEACRSEFIARIAGWAQQYDLDGINFDFEKMDPADQEQFTELVAQCKQALPAGSIVSVCVTVPLKNPEGNWWQCYDRKGLGEAADYVAVMAYDNPDMEPVAALDWVNGKVRDMLTMVPGDKILLGMPFYGVDLQFDAPAGQKLEAMPDFQKSKARKTVTPATMQKLIETGTYGSGKSAVTVDYWIGKGLWSDEEGMAEYSFVDTAGVLHLMYCDDERSVQAKAMLLAYERLAGAAVWRLEFGNEPMWKALAQGLSRQ